MNTSRSMIGWTFAAALVLGISAPSVFAAQQQSVPTEDHSASATEAVSDAWITTKVKADLATTKGIEDSNISVTTVNGVVTLTGVLPSNIEVDKAVAVAKGIKGVKDVDAAGLKAK